VPKSRDYQLVIQFVLDDADLARYDAVTEFETALIEGLANDSDVDGHDAGSGEVNIFIHTGDPAATLKLVQTLLERDALRTADYRAGYRLFTEDDYTPAWPPGLESFEVL
jgi:hypothetical protein